MPQFETFDLETLPRKIRDSKLIQLTYEKVLKMADDITKIEQDVNTLSGKVDAIANNLNQQKVLIQELKKANTDGGTAEQRHGIIEKLEESINEIDSVLNPPDDGGSTGNPTDGGSGSGDAGSGDPVGGGSTGQGSGEPVDDGGGSGEPVVDGEPISE